MSRLLMGASSIAYYRDDGSMEIVEFGAQGHAIHRTYGKPVSQ